MDIKNTIERFAAQHPQLIKPTTHPQTKSDETFDMVSTITENFFSKEERPFVEQILKNTHTHCIEQRAINASDMPLGTYLLLTAKVLQLLLPLRHIIGWQPFSAPTSIITQLVYQYVEDKPQAGSFLAACNGRKLSLNLNEVPVDARTRRLHTSCPLEAIQDLGTQNALDLEAELTLALAYEIAHDYVAEVIGDLKSLACKNSEFEVDCNTTQVPSLHDKLTPLFTALQRASNEIARRTRRGCGNTVITTPAGASAIQTVLSNTDRYALKFDPLVIKSKSEPFTHVGNLVYRDTGNILFKVFTTPHLHSTTNNDDIFLVGYKGNTGEEDTGYIIGPYVPVVCTGILIHPTTYQPCTGFMGRYAKYVRGANTTEDKGTILGQPSDYYHIVRVKGLKDVKPADTPKTSIFQIDLGDSSPEEASYILERIKAELQSKKTFDV